MFAVLAEDHSDADTIEVLIKRLFAPTRSRVYKSGFGGCGELIRKAGSHMRNFEARGASRFIVCHDSDGKDPAAVKEAVETAIRLRNCSHYRHSIVVPVQEIEAWILADESAIRAVIPTLRLEAIRHPEMLPSPKDWLRKESKRGRTRPLYIPTVHNAKVAQHIDLHTLEVKCPSFRPLKDFVQSPD